MSNQWNENDADVIRGECDSCGETRLVVKCRDPFLAEIYPESDNPERWMCLLCYEARADEI